jgi:hypothetical protein
MVPPRRLKPTPKTGLSAASSGARARRLARLEERLNAIEKKTDAHFKRAAALQAQLDHLLAKICF